MTHLQRMEATHNIHNHDGNATYQCHDADFSHD